MPTHLDGVVISLATSVSRARAPAGTSARAAARAGVQMAEAVPDSYLPEYDIEDADENPELRLGRYAREHLVVRDREHDFYDDDVYE